MSASRAVLRKTFHSAWRQKCRVLTGSDDHLGPTRVSLAIPLFNTFFEQMARTGSGARTVTGIESVRDEITKACIFLQGDWVLNTSHS